MAVIPVEEPHIARAPKGFVPFALGFRPFFLLAGIAAVLLLPLWLLVLADVLRAPDYFGAATWHGHTMLFGYAVAVIAGFLLTAVRNWTGVQTATGTPLALLAALWLAGRIAPFLPLPGWSIAVVDIAFLPALAIALAIPLLRAGQRHNLVFLPVLALMTLANVLVHAQALSWSFTATTGLRLMTDLVLLLITIIGGRVIPFFTESAIPGFKARRHAAIEWASIGTLIALLLAHAFTVPAMMTAILAAAAALAQGLRLSGWLTRAAWNVPLLRVLHLGYGWLVIGFALETFEIVGWTPSGMALHAHTAGAIGVLTLGMMARVSLGHSGRLLQPAASIAFSFTLLNVAVLLRLLAVVLPAPAYLPSLTAAGLVWTLAFAIFLWVYAPILVKSRVDGRPG
ncbi:MAG: NnrS family protein [Ectothiorhodospiraceae bacterium]|jgi:uncharacterized protein involved in response to NO|nr:NnrS family protein [Ectothiorhodospiraceae bacterium]